MTHVFRRAHLGFVVELNRPVADDDSDLLDGHYLDANGEHLGEIILESRRPPRRFLLVVEDEEVAVHVEATLESDHRTDSRARRAVLRYPTGADVPQSVREDGELWKTDEEVAFAFASEEQAMLAQGRV
ncbi:MAG: hypothetical protein AB7J35_03170 [Dehalococcoidia bacterium]